MKIKFKNRIFSSYYELLNYLVYNKMFVRTSYFPRSELYYCKAALEEKFQREFKFSEIKELIKSAYADDHSITSNFKDLPHTSSTSSNN